jgi:hypothetical protein
MGNNEVKLCVRMPREMRELVATMAEKDRRSVNGQILMILERAAKDYQAAPTAGPTAKF